MIENRIIHYHSYGLIGGPAVYDQKWDIRINFYKNQDILNFYNYFGFVLKNIDRENTTVGYYHWSKARISTPISFSSTDYILERDNDQVPDRVKLEEEILNPYKKEMAGIKAEEDEVIKHYSFFSMWMWFWLGFMTCFMCPVYIVKKKHENKLMKEIKERKIKICKDLLSKIEFIDSK